MIRKENPTFDPIPKQPKIQDTLAVKPSSITARINFLSKKPKSQTTKPHRSRIVELTNLRSQSARDLSRLDTAIKKQQDKQDGAEARRTFLLRSKSATAGKRRVRVHKHVELSDKQKKCRCEACKAARHKSKIGGKTYNPSLYEKPEHAFFTQ